MREGKNCSNVCKEAGTCGWISRVARDCKPLDWYTRAKHARSWNVTAAIHYRTKVPGWPVRLLEAWTRDWVENGLASLGLLSCSEQLAWRFSFWHAWHVCFNLAACSRESPTKSSHESLLLCTHLSNSSHFLTYYPYMIPT